MATLKYEMLNLSSLKSEKKTTDVYCFSHLYSLLKDKSTLATLDKARISNPEIPKPNWPKTLSP